MTVLVSHQGVPILHILQQNCSHDMKRNNNSEGVDGNEQGSSNVKEAPKPKRTKCNSIAKVRKE